MRDTSQIRAVAYELTVVVPTFNERGNVEVLIDRLRVALDGVAWQAIFVDDDSADGTAAAVKAVAGHDARIQCLRRVRRRGLAGAVIEGILASAAPFVAVIDGDLQHDETLLPDMLAALQADRADLVVASRFLSPEGVEHGLSTARRFGSRVASWMARQLLRDRFTDPVSGFFMLRRELVEAVAPRLSDQGFKILFDIIASQDRKPRVLEMPYAFAKRISGASKLDGRIVIDYLGLLLNKLSRGALPPRAFMFLVVGASGVVVHLGVLRLLLMAALPFAAAQLMAALTAMTSNFLVNNAITYRDRRLTGLAMLRGYVRFCTFCAIGLTANICVADVVHRLPVPWWLAGVAGAAIGAMWNYVSTSRAVW